MDYEQLDKIDKPIDQWETYPEYQSTNISWLGDVPTHWELRKLKTTVDSCLNGVWGDEPDNDDNPIVCVRVADFNRTSFRIDTQNLTYRSIPIKQQQSRMLSCGDLLLEKSGGGEKQLVGTVMLFDHNFPAVCSNFVAKMRVSSGHDGIFLTYLHAHLYSSRVNLRSIKQNTGIQNLDSKQYLDEVVALPPPEEQQSIATFLDRETAKIDDLIAKKQRLIELLQEQRSAIISHAVTKGLDPDVPIKDSGIEWLGDIPAHWDTRQLGKVITLQRGFDINKDEQIEGNVPVVSSGGILSFHDSATCYNPGVVIGRKGTVGSIYYVDVPFWAHGTTLYVKDFKGNHPKYVYYLLHTFDLKGFDTGTANPTLNRNVLHPVHVAHMNCEEQISIANHIDFKLDNINKLIQQLNQTIDMIQEYRTALISSAVTGKIDVRGEV